MRFICLDALNIRKRFSRDLLRYSCKFRVLLFSVYVVNVFLGGGTVVGAFEYWHPLWRSGKSGIFKMLDMQIGEISDMVILSLLTKSFIVFVLSDTSPVLPRYFQGRPVFHGRHHSRHHDRSGRNTCPLPGRYLVVTCPVPGRYLVGTWSLLVRYLVVTWSVAVLIAN
jgi:hypothetical protein